MEGNSGRDLPEIKPHEPARRGHEERDVNVWAVGKFGIALALLCIAALALLLGVFRFFEKEIAGPAAPPRELGMQDGSPLEPRLQETPLQDLKQIRAVEDQILGSYGWVDKEKGIVRLPIDRAIDLLAQRGLPARREDAPVTAAAAVSVPSESGLGPKMIPAGGPLGEDVVSQSPGTGTPAAAATPTEPRP
jgi:hypothetical protein